MLSVNHLFKWKKMIELAVLGCRPGLFVLDPTLFFIFCLIQQQLTMCTTSDQVSQLGLGDIPILPPRCLSGNGKTLRFLIFVPLLVISAFFSIGNTLCVKLCVLVGTWFFLTKSPESSKMLLICNLKSLCWPLIKLGLKSGNYQQICAALGAGNDAYKLAEKLEKHICCSYGKTFSSPHHLTWHCPDRLVPEDLVNPVHTAEENFFSVPSPSQLWCLVCLKFVLPNHLINHFRYLSMPSSHVTTMWPSSCSLGMPVWERLYLGINRSTRLKLLLCWLHFVQPIRSVFLSTSSLIAFWYYKKPGVSEQVVLCHVLFDPGLWKHVSFLSPHSMWHFIPSHGKNLSWSPLGQHSAILWRQLSSLADTNANSIAHREFQHVKAYCRPWFLSMLLNGLIRHWHARCKSFRLLNKIWQLHRLHRRSHSTCLSSIRSISHDFLWCGALCRDSCSKLHDLQTQVTAAASKNTHTHNSGMQRVCIGQSRSSPRRQCTFSPKTWRRLGDQDWQTFSCFVFHLLVTTLIGSLDFLALVVPGALRSGCLRSGWWCLH